MKTAIISDIHSNLAAFEAVLADIGSQGAEQTLSLGDIIGYGPDPAEVVKLLRAHRIVSILGNHEYALSCPSYFEHLNPSPRKSLEMNLAQLDPQAIGFLTNLPQVITEQNARFVHGCPPKSPTSYLMEPPHRLLAKIFPSYPESICFFGHTHTLDFIEWHNGKAEKKPFTPGLHQLHPEARYLINPGSVGQPRDGLNNQAKYLIWDTAQHTILLRSISYDVKKTAARLRQLGYPDFNAERLFY